MDGYDLRLDYDTTPSRHLGGIGLVVYHHMNNMRGGGGSGLSEFLDKVQSTIIQNRNMARQRMDVEGWFLQRYMGERPTEVVLIGKHKK